MRFHHHIVHPSFPMYSASTVSNSIVRNGTSMVHSKSVDGRAYTVCVKSNILRAYVPMPSQSAFAQESGPSEQPITKPVAISESLGATTSKDHRIASVRLNPNFRFLPPKRPSCHRIVTCEWSSCRSEPAVDMACYRVRANLLGYARTRLC